MKNCLLILAIIITKISASQNCDATFSISYDSTTNIISTLPINNSISQQHIWTVYINESPAYVSSPLIDLSNGGIELMCPSGQFSIQVCHRLIDTTTNCNVLDCDTIIIESNRRCNPYFFSIWEPASVYYMHVGSNTDEEDIWILNGDTIAIGDTNFIAYTLLNYPTDSIEHIVYDSLGCYANANNSITTTVFELIYHTVKIYPNPFSEALCVNTELNNINTTLYNLEGKIIANGSNQIQNLGRLMPGFYIAIIRNKHGEIIKREKLVKVE
jgi:hypothetical protein